LSNAFLGGDVETGKAFLRDYLNGTESITDVARELQINEKSLRRAALEENISVVPTWKWLLTF